MAFTDRFIFINSTVELQAVGPGQAAAASITAPYGSWPEGMEAYCQYVADLLQGGLNDGMPCSELQEFFPGLLEPAIGNAAEGMTVPSPAGQLVIPADGAATIGPSILFQYTDMAGTPRDATYRAVPDDDNNWSAEWVGDVPAFPMVIGTNCRQVTISSQGNGTGVNYQFTTSGMAPMAYDPELFCDMVPACCGGPGPTPSIAPILGSMLPLPPPEEREENEQRATAPPLETVISYANHTFELPPFGRGK